MAGIKTTLLDIFKRIVPFNKKLGIIFNGADNAYPERVDRFINNSVTAKTSSRIMASYLAGKGWGKDDNKTVVHKDNKTTLLKFTNKVSQSLAKQRGVFIHINYNMNFTFDSFDVLPYNHCRLGKKDDNKYNGKIVVYDKFTEGRQSSREKSFREKEFNILDVFNPNEKVIQSQVDAVKGWENYKGQIWYVNLDEDYFYALSQIDPVLHDCDSEGQASLFKNSSLRRGFFGKEMVITKPLAGDRDEFPIGNEGDVKFADAQSERENFKKTMEGFLGAGNNDGLLHVEMELDGDDFDKEIKFEQINSNINDKLFAYTESSIFLNILMAFNNIPADLVRSTSGVFSNSGDSLNVMKETYQESTIQERESLIETVKVLMKGFRDSKEITFVPLIEVDTTKQTKE